MTLYEWETYIFYAAIFLLAVSDDRAAGAVLLGISLMLRVFRERCSGCSCPGVKTTVRDTTPPKKKKKGRKDGC